MDLKLPAQVQLTPEVSRDKLKEALTKMTQTWFNKTWAEFDINAQTFKQNTFCFAQYCSYLNKKTKSLKLVLFSIKSGGPSGRSYPTVGWRLGPDLMLQSGRVLGHGVSHLREA